VLDDVSMSEVGGGGYKYDFTSLFDSTKDYFFVADGGDTLIGAERYVYATSIMIGDVDIIRKIEQGRWKIINNQLIFYDDDDTTSLITFNLKDADGNLTEVNPKERMPV